MIRSAIARRSENSNEIVSVISNSRITIMAIAFVNDFVQDGHVELFRLGSFYCYNLIGHTQNFLAILFCIFALDFFRIAIFHIISISLTKTLYLIIYIILLKLITIVDINIYGDGGRQILNNICNLLYEYIKKLIQLKK